MTPFGYKETKHTQSNSTIFNTFAPFLAPKLKVFKVPILWESGAKVALSALTFDFGSFLKFLN